MGVIPMGEHYQSIFLSVIVLADKFKFIEMLLNWTQIPGDNNMKLSIIFEEKPERWGFRGDPYFWDYLKEHAENMEIISPEELEEWIKEEYLSLSGKPLTDEYMDFAVIKQFAHGGMSSGGVDNRWWMEKGIPLLKNRLTTLN